MSVALRGSPRGSLGTLRRTASLEFFLDMDKECAVEEVELDTPPPRPLAGVALSGLNHGIKVGVAPKAKFPAACRHFLCICNQSYFHIVLDKTKPFAPLKNTISTG